MEETDNQDNNREAKQEVKQEDNRTPAPEAGHPDMSPGPGKEPSAAQGTSGEETTPAKQESPQKLSLKDELLLLFKKPSQAFASIAAFPNWGRAVAIVLLTSVSGYLINMPPVGWEEGFPFAGATYIMLAPLVAVLFIPLWLFSGLLTHGVAKLFKGSGSLAQTILVSAYSGVPLLLEWLLVPFSVTLGLIRTPEPVSMAVSSLLGTVLFGLTVWGFVLLIIGLRRIHGFTTGRAVGAACLPTFGCGCLVIIIAAALIFLGVFAGIEALQGLEGI